MKTNRTNHSVVPSQIQGSPIVFLLFGLLLFLLSPGLVNEACGNGAYASEVQGNKLHGNEASNKIPEVHIRKNSVSLYLSPDKKSEVLKILPYGHPVVWDGEYLLDPNKHWIPVKEKDGLAGFLMRSQVILYAKKDRFKILSKEIERQIQYISGFNDQLIVKDSRFLDSAIQLTDFLFDSVKEADYSGDQFLYLKLRAGESLAITAKLINERDNADFIAKYHNYLTKNSKNSDSNQSAVRFDENYFWKYASLYQNLKSGELSAELAIQYSPDPDCDSEPSCYLEYLHDSFLHYLIIYPKGKNSKIYLSKVSKLLNDYTRDLDQVRCFPPSPPSMYKKVDDFKLRMDKILTSYTSQGIDTNQTSLIFKKKFPWYFNWKLSISKIEKECFPRI